MINTHHQISKMLFIVVALLHLVIGPDTMWMSVLYLVQCDSDAMRWCLWEIMILTLPYRAQPVCQDIWVNMAAVPHSGLTPAKKLTRPDLPPRISLTSVMSHHKSEPRARFRLSLVIINIQVGTIPLQNGQMCPQWLAGLVVGLGLLLTCDFLLVQIPELEATHCGIQLLHVIRLTAITPSTPYPK
jgi:hypothetical protein